MRMSDFLGHFLGRPVTVDSAGYRFKGKLLAFEDILVYERSHRVLKKAKESSTHAPALLVLEGPERGPRFIVRGWSKMQTEAAVQ